MVMNSDYGVMLVPVGIYVARVPRSVLQMDGRIRDAGSTPPAARCPMSVSQVTARKPIGPT